MAECKRRFFFLTSYITLLCSESTQCPVSLKDRSAIQSVVCSIAAAGRDQSFRGERSSDLFHVTSRRLHCRSANERA